MSVSGLFVWKDTCSLGYPCLESFLSVESLCDDFVICVDPNSDDETLKLCQALKGRHGGEGGKVQVRYFEWPISGDGSVIGDASNYALMFARGEHVLNVQADEVWPTELVKFVKDNWTPISKQASCYSFKVLNTEHNAQSFQGGESWDGRRAGDVWNRGGMWNGKQGAESLGGAGYNRSVKLWKKEANVRFAHDGWSMEGCGSLHHLQFSEQYPIIHLHDFMRDHLIDLRRNAADKLWTDQSKFGNYKQSADEIEATANEWMRDPKWLSRTSPFMDLLPPVARRLLGQTSYRIDWSLLE